MKFKKLNERGRGGFGRVSEVQSENGDHYAVKEFEPNDEIQAIIAKGHISREDLKRRFFKEVKYQSQV